MVNLTDSSGAKATSYNYKAFGEMRAQTGSVTNPWLFTGRQFDAESGLYYNRNRYYSPTIGRFTTPDPSLTLTPSNIVIPYLLLGQLNNPLELQRYLYCINNPVNLIDPWGLCGWEQLIREQKQLELELLLKIGGFYVGTGAALISTGVTIGWTPLGATLVAAGIFLEAKALYEFVDWATRYGELYREIRRYQEREAIGTETGMWGYSFHSP